MSYVALDNVQVGSYNVNCKRNLRIYINAQHASCQAQDRRKVWKMRFGTSVCFGFWNIYLQKRLGDSVGSKLRNLYDPRQADAACSPGNGQWAQGCGVCKERKAASL